MSDLETHIEGTEEPKPPRKNRAIRVLLLVLICVVAGAGGYLLLRPAPSQPEVAPNTIGLTGPALYELSTTWCPACKEMKPIVDKLEAAYKDRVKFNRFDLDTSKEGQDISSALSMQYIPGYILVDSDNKIVDKWEGAVSEPDLEAKLDALK